MNGEIALIWERIHALDRPYPPAAYAFVQAGLRHTSERLEREQEMSFIEFNYMVCQSYDYVELARRHGSNLQMGGSDQWGNIVNGVDLGRRMGDRKSTRLNSSH